MTYYKVKNYNFRFFILYKLWKILKEMGIQDHLTCLLRNLYAGQEATVRTGHRKTDFPAPPPLSPFSPPDLDRRVDSPDLDRGESGRGSDLPVAPQDEAGLTKTFQTWPRGWFHIP